MLMNIVILGCGFALLDVSELLTHQACSYARLCACVHLVLLVQSVWPRTLSIQQRTTTFPMSGTTKENGLLFPFCHTAPLAFLLAFLVRLWLIQNNLCVVALFGVGLSK